MAIFDNYYLEEFKEKKMNHNIISEFDFATAYKEALSRVYLSPEYVSSPRGSLVKEILNMQITIESPYSNLFTNEARSVPKKYLANELLLYFAGTDDAYKFEGASKMWGIIKNENNTVNSAYGNLIFTDKSAEWNDDMHFFKKVSQWQWAKKSLIADKDSRQAIMHYNRPSHQYKGVKDFPCTLYNQFFIRENKLYMSCYMRSSDIYYGITFDIPFFMLLMQCMRLELLEYYPELTLGTYTHNSGSFHIYEKDFKIAEEMLKHEFVPDYLPILVENPIYNKDVVNIFYNQNISTNDEFINWILENK